MPTIKRSEPENSPRRQVAYVSILGTTQLHLRNPFMIAFWSMMFPGLGHLLLSKYLRGYVLFIWEVLINVKAHLNLAILYSFTGRFEIAKDVLDTRWFLLYMPTFLFAIWDSYRTSVDINHNYILSVREDAKIKPFTMNALEINYLDKRLPWVSLAWSILMPGAGQLYIHRIITTLFILVWWIAVIYLSKILPAIHYTFMGQFELAKSVIDAQWFLNIPSIYFFAMYDAYTNTVENNKLYDWEQSKFFNQYYQRKSFRMPSKKNTRGENMYILSIFEHSKYLELAITAIEMKGIAKENILAVSMDKRAEDRMLFDSIHHSDGLSLLDLPILLGAIGSLLGVIYGFILAWGPIIWGLIGLVICSTIGLTIKIIMAKKNSIGRRKHMSPEVVLIIECLESQLEMVKDTLWSHYALGVRKLDLGTGNKLYLED